MLRKFYKMQGIGNDYIYFDCLEEPLENPAAAAVKLSDRHFGIGGDGVVLICPSEIADAKMRMFNADGSEGKMCGNAIRCVGKYLYDSGRTDKRTLKIETLSGVRTLFLNVEGGKVKSARVDMGTPEFRPEHIPVSLPGGKIVARETEISGGRVEITCVSMGNPHCVVFGEDPDRIDLEKVGPQFENADIFPDRVNTEFVHIVARNELKMRVWERGSGETLACGTGACAAAAAAVENGFADPDSDIIVHLKGGDLVIRRTAETVYMTGEAALVFSGEVEP